MHIAKGLFYNSYKEPRILLWTIGVIIFIVMMAILNLWPNCEFDNISKFGKIIEESYSYDTLYSNSGYLIKNNFILGKMLPFNKARTKALERIGPHNKQILDLIICGLLGDFWGEKIKSQKSNSVRFNIEQSISNSSYIHYLTLLFYEFGYCARPVPTLVPNYEKLSRNRFNYRLSLFTFSNLVWIYDSFYLNNGIEGNTHKKVPKFIFEYLSPMGLCHWIMQAGSVPKGQGINLATNSFTYADCLFLASILASKYNLKTSVVKTGFPNQWRIAIWKESMSLLTKIITPYLIPEMVYKIKGF